MSTARGADDDWSQCGAGFQVPARPVSEAAEPGGDPGAIDLSADDGEFVEGGVSTFTGNVRIQRGTQQFLADALTYDGEILEAEGNVRLWDEGIYVTGRRARAEAATAVVTVESGPSYMFEDAHGHGEAVRLTRFGNARTMADDATYTTCNPGGDDAWRITARNVEFDHVDDTGTARDIWLEFMGQRVFYMPWVSFPLSDRRKSGFLVPTYGMGGSRGFELTTPYYFNLAPNYDATLTARAMSERGVQALGEFRFLSRTYGPAGSRRNTCPPTRNSATIVRRSISRTGTGGRAGGRRIPASNGHRTRSTSGISERVSPRAAEPTSHAGSMRTTTATDGVRASGSGIS